MTTQPHTDRLRNWCLVLAVVAVLLTAVSVRADLPQTTFNALIDGARFVVAVAATWFGLTLLITGRPARRVTADRTTATSVVPARAPSAPRTDPEPAELEPVDRQVIDLRDDVPRPQPARPSSPSPRSTAGRH